MKVERLQVFVRIRPFMSNELEYDNVSPFTVNSENKISCKYI